MDELSATQPRSREPTISTLKTYYGDEALSQMINAAQKNPSTQTLATELQTRQLQYWLNDRRAPADVLKLLGLTKTGDNLFDNPQFILQNEQFQLWMKKGWSSNAIFNVLHLDKAGDKLLSNPLVVTWNKYLSAFNWENPDKKTTLWAILKYHDYSDDSVGYLLAAARKIPGTEAITAHFEVLQYWLATRKIPNYVFSKLRLDRAGYNLLANPLFSTWIQYFDGFIVKFPDTHPSHNYVDLTGMSILQ
ncbi:hypothetical protein GQ600_14684 [Phytophthora cactorum]|nr:hypothetical protein GQ600_14684 [Phytophthora cactorum]